MGDGRLEFIPGSRGGLTQMGFEFGKSQFNRVEVRTVGRQVTKAHASVRKNLTHALNLAVSIDKIC
jgi:hypothetical protein